MDYRMTHTNNDTLWHHPRQQVNSQHQTASNNGGQCASKDCVRVKSVGLANNQSINQRMTSTSKKAKCPLLHQSISVDLCGQALIRLAMTFVTFSCHHLSKRDNSQNSTLLGQCTGHGQQVDFQWTTMTNNHWLIHLPDSLCFHTPFLHLVGVLFYFQKSHHFVYLT